MYSSQLKVSLLSLSVLLALSSTNTLAAKFTVEQRLEMLENQLSENKSELKKTQNELTIYKEKVAALQKNAQGNTPYVTSRDNLTAFAPVADNIENEDPVAGSVFAPTPVNSTQKVAVVNNEGGKHALKMSP